MTRVLTRAKVKAWLEGKDGDEVVGEATMFSSCPIATYLSEQPSVCSSPAPIADAYSYVYVDCSRGLRKRVEVWTPNWARKFVEGVDDLQTEEMGEQGIAPEVTAREALAILRRCG